MCFADVCPGRQDQEVRRGKGDYTLEPASAQLKPHVECTAHNTLIPVARLPGSRIPTANPRGLLVKKARSLLLYTMGLPLA